MPFQVITGVNLVSLYGNVVLEVLLYGDKETVFFLLRTMIWTRSGPIFAADQVEKLPVPLSVPH